jgi:arsenate reductase
MKLYGIPNCETVKKARAWLDARGVAYVFHDYKRAGVDANLLKDFTKQLGWEALVNRRGTTWRRLSEAQRAGIVDQASAIALMVEQPSLIKRPVLERDGAFHVGFSDSQYQHILGA